MSWQIWGQCAALRSERGECKMHTFASAFSPFFALDLDCIGCMLCEEEEQMKKK